jgi:hypothetical protein
MEPSSGHLDDAGCGVVGGLLQQSFVLSNELSDGGTAIQIGVEVALDAKRLPLLNHVKRQLKLEIVAWVQLDPVTEAFEVQAVRGWVDIENQRYNRNAALVTRDVQALNE